jgi:hypothetical protein
MRPSREELALVRTGAGIQLRPVTVIPAKAGIQLRRIRRCYGLDTNCMREVILRPPRVRPHLAQR